MGIRIKRVIALVLSISLLDMQLVYGGNKSKVTGYDTDSFDKLTDISFNLYHSDAGEEFKIYGIDIDTLIDFLSYNYSLGGFLDNWEYIEDENYVQVRIKNKTDAIVRQRRTEEFIRDWLRNREGTLEDVKDLFIEIVNNTEYDYSEKHTSAYDIVFNKIGTCHGIALFINKTLEGMGIESYYLLGRTKKGELHAWNSFIIDGVTYTADATHALPWKYTDRIWEYFLKDSSMTLGDGRTVLKIY